MLAFDGHLHIDEELHELRYNALKYKTKSADDINICVTGSVDGVITADIIVEITTTYFHADNIFCPDMIFKKPKINCIIGTWNDKPVVNIRADIKLKYWSNDQSGSTTSEPYEIKNFKAAGTRKK